MLARLYLHKVFFLKNDCIAQKKKLQIHERNYYESKLFQRKSIVLIFINLMFNIRFK